MDRGSPKEFFTSQAALGTGGEARIAPVEIPAGRWDAGFAHRNDAHVSPHGGAVLRPAGRRLGIRLSESWAVA